MKTIAHRKYELGPKDFRSEGSLTDRGLMQFRANTTESSFPIMTNVALPFSTKMSDYDTLSLWGCWDGGSYVRDTKENGIPTTERSISCDEIPCDEFPFYNDAGWHMFNYSPITKQILYIRNFGNVVSIMLDAMEDKRHSVLHLEKMILSF